MLLFRNPMVAVRRIWYTGGNGIHSPFAYQMVTQVIDCPGAYYADRQLYPFSERLLHPRRTAVRRLMFRLANRWQPTKVRASVEFQPYIAAGCKRADVENSDETYVSMYGNEGLMMVLPDLQSHKALWREWKERNDVRVTFDLYDVGIAVCAPRLNKQNYKINW